MINNLSLSEKYAIATVIALLFLTALGNATVMLVVSALGLAVGVLISRKEGLRRAGIVATIGFAVAAAFAVVMLLRRL